MSLYLVSQNSKSPIDGPRTVAKPIMQETFGPLTGAEWVELAGRVRDTLHKGSPAPLCFQKLIASHNVPLRELFDAQWGGR